MNIDHQLKQMVNTFGEERVRDNLKNLAEIEADKCRFKIRKVRQKLAVFEDRVLTLKEVAKYLKIPEEKIEKQALRGMIPGRRIEDEWRFLKTAIDDWLRNYDSRVILLSQAGALSDDDSLDKLR